MEYFTSAERHSSPSTWNWRRQFQGGRPSWRLRPKITKIINIRVQLNSCSSRVVKSRVSVLLKVSFLSLIPSSGRNSVCCCVLRCPSERAFIQSNDHCWIIVLKIVLTLMWGYAFSSLFEIFCIRCINLLNFYFFFYSTYCRTVLHTSSLSLKPSHNSSLSLWLYQTQ